VRVEELATPVPEAAPLFMSATGLLWRTFDVIAEGSWVLMGMYRNDMLRPTMSPKAPTALRVDVDLMNAMRALKDDKGIPVTT
jgi:hypothetical protein